MLCYEAPEAPVLRLRLLRSNKPGEAPHQAGSILQGMSLAPSVTELLMAEFMYLQTESETQPIYFYINSAGVQVFPRIVLCSPRLHKYQCSTS